MTGVNTELFRYIFGFAHRSSFLDAVIAFAASYLPYVIVLAWVFFWLSRKEWRLRVLFCIEGIIAALAARGVVTEAVKFFYVHPRPLAVLDIQTLVQASGNSFPSGHAAFFFALAASLFFADRPIGAWCLLIASINGLARVTAGVHWPFDIAGGAMIGILGAVAAHALLEPIFRAIKKGHASPDENVPRVEQPVF